jgi:flagellar basal-body rod protein FlgB
MKSLIDTSLDVTAAALDMRMHRQNVVTSNLANIKTPGYKAKRVEFEAQLQAAIGTDQSNKMTATNGRHLPTSFDPADVNAQTSEILRSRVVQGQDSVDMDKEMAVMAKNALAYNTLTMVMQKGFEGIKNVIMEGNK